MHITASLSPNGEISIDTQSAPTRLLVATTDGVFVCARDARGGPWRMVTQQLEGKHVSAMVVMKGDAGVVAGTHGDGLFFSVDGETGWDRRASGLDHSHIYTVAAGPGEGEDVLYAGAEPVALYRSENRGTDWVELPAIKHAPHHQDWRFPSPPHHAHVKYIAPDPEQAGVIYVAIEQGALLRSADRGTSWVELDSYLPAYNVADRDIHRLVIAPRNPHELYMTSGMGSFHSLDRGQSWEKLTGTDFSIGYPDHLAVSPLDERTLFMAGARSDPRHWRTTHSADGSVYRSRDKGQTWQPFTTGLAIGRAQVSAMTLAAYPGGFSLFIATTAGEAYCCDNGQDWQLISHALAPVSKGIHSRILARPAA